MRAGAQGMSNTLRIDICQSIFDRSFWVLWTSLKTFKPLLWVGELQRAAKLAI